MAAVIEAQYPEGLTLREEIEGEDAEVIAAQKLSARIENDLCQQDQPVVKNAVFDLIRYLDQRAEVWYLRIAFVDENGITRGFRLGPQTEIDLS